MKVAFVTERDPLDVHAWSGSIYHIYDTLCRQATVTTWWKRRLALIDHDVVFGLGTVRIACLRTEKLIPSRWS
jgi:hypothetical protein